MFEDLLPARAEFRKLATREAHFVQKIRVSSLPRIASVVSDNDGFVSVDLNFGLNHKYQVVIQGNINAQVTMICQRCLEPLAVVINTDVNVIVTTEDRVKEIDKQFDPLITDTDWVDLNDLVQEELLLAIPFISYHESEDCSGKQFYQSMGEPAAEKLAGTNQNPFHMLSKLKTNNKE